MWDLTDNNAFLALGLALENFNESQEQVSFKYLENICKKKIFLEL